MITILIILLSACRQKMIILKSPPGYNFADVKIMKLDPKLKNISGIAWDKKRDVFFALEDNSDKLYLLERDTKNIMATYNLGEKGEYKDVAVVDSIPYILKSDGTLFKYVSDSLNGSALEQLGKLQPEANSVFESLFYDPARKALIIIGKTSEKGEESKINAYAYYIDSTGLNPKPVFQLDISAIEKLAPRKSSIPEPTAAAINPLQQKIYFLSASSKQLIITDLNGKAEGVYVLMSSMFPEPEGICFQKNGDMYISNKGGNGNATMLKFTFSNKSDKNKKTGNPELGYDLSNPDDKMEMGKHLREISGIAYIPGKDIMLAENDEKGEIFTVDFKNKKDDFEKIKFGEKGDYEDIVYTDTSDYLLLSSGTVVQVRTKNDILSTQEFRLVRNGSNEYETLYYDSADHSLIMLCKQCAQEKEKLRSAFRFDLATHKFSDKPVYDIDIGTIRILLNDETAEFKPSAAAINPVTGKLFVVASVGKLLVIADKKGNVEQVFRLDPKLFNQPEGLTFAPNGDLYISNEGGEGIATILKFIYKP
ncbi:MAG: SdiA-regulated domain-containing protein [Chitinophagales bacterium]